MKQLKYTDMQETKPEEFVDSYIFSENGKLWAECIGKEVLEEIATKKCFVVMGKKRKTGKQWESNTNGATEILNKDTGENKMTVKKQAYSNWIVQRQTNEGEVILEGPFVNKEMKGLLFKKMLDGTHIKRDCDAGFLPFETVYNEYNNFIYEDTDLISKLYNIHVTDVKVESTDERRIYKNAKVNTFLENNKIAMTHEEIVSLIRNKTKNNSIGLLKRKLDINDKKAGDLLDLIVRESKKQLLVDVDADGFAVQKGKKGPQKNY